MKILTSAGDGLSSKQAGPPMQEDELLKLAGRCGSAYFEMV